MLKKPKQYEGSVEKKIPEVQVKLEAALKSELPQLSKLEDSAWEYGLTFGLKKEDAAEVFKKLRDADSFLFNMLVDVTAVDWMDKREPRFDVVYQLMSLTHQQRLTIKIQVPEENPEVESVLPLWPSANFMEREVWDMFGIKFNNHGDLRRILMYDEFTGHPLRKDYPKSAKQPRVELRIPELRNTSQDMLKEQLVSLPTRR